MVRVNNMESVESRSITSHKPENGASAEALKLMEKTQLPNTGKREEPSQLVFSEEIYVCNRPGKSHVITPGERDFRPDPTLSSRSAREWQEKHKEQSQKPMELNKDGQYEVKPGDSFASIAKRDLKKDGKEPSQAEIDKRSKELQEINKDSTSNGHYLKPGMTLRMKLDGDKDCKLVGGSQRYADGSGSGWGTSDMPSDRRGGGGGGSGGGGGRGAEGRSDSHVGGGGGDGNSRSSGHSAEGGGDRQVGGGGGGGGGGRSGSIETRPAEGIMNAPGYVPRAFRTRPESGMGIVVPKGESYNLTDKPDGNIDRINAQAI